MGTSVMLDACVKGLVEVKSTSGERAWGTTSEGLPNGACVYLKWDADGLGQAV